MNGINNPHDKLFSKTLSDIQTVREFLRLQLPEKILKNLNMDTISLANSSYVDERLAEFFCDLVFRIDLNKDEKAYIVCLFEHKSTVERATVFQIFKYFARIWDEIYKDNYLPVIIPILFYHGKERWTAPMKLSGLMKGNLDWAVNIIPDFEYYLYTMEDMKNILPRITVTRLRLYVKILNLTHSKSANEYMKKLADIALELNDYYVNQGMKSYFRISFRYIFEAADYNMIKRKDILDELKKIIPERSDDIMTVAEEIRREGLELGLKQGIEQGIERGIEQELKETIIIQLEKKFKINLSAEMKEKIEKTDRVKLIKIRNNIFDIEGMEEVEQILQG